MTPREEQHLHDLGVYLGIYDGGPSMIEGWLCEERWDEKISVSRWFFYDNSKRRKQFRTAPEVARYLGLQVSHARIQSFPTPPSNNPNSRQLHKISTWTKGGKEKKPKITFVPNKPRGPKRTKRELRQLKFNSFFGQTPFKQSEARDCFHSEACEEVAHLFQRQFSRSGTEFGQDMTQDCAAKILLILVEQCFGPIDGLSPELKKTIMLGLPGLTIAEDNQFVVDSVTSNHHLSASEVARAYGVFSFLAHSPSQHIFIDFGTGCTQGVRLAPFAAKAEKGEREDLEDQVSKNPKYKNGVEKIVL